jgi:hypothetical protein|tara:strand:+ start:301 stop:585 length:285 start_codon:yes stop_codon:yes gene_type:complete
MANIPQARDYLKVALGMDISEDVRHMINLAMSEMVREYTKVRAPRQARSVTRSIIIGVKQYAGENPTASCIDIGVMFNIGVGRVSEILAGKRVE